MGRELFSSTRGLCLLAGLWVVRLLSSVVRHVDDCDETFNYWEPLHFLLFGQGLQTWEYAPRFALRSWPYLEPLAAVGAAVTWGSGEGADKVQTFFLLRSALAAACAASECAFAMAVARRFGDRIGLCTALFLLSSSGMFLSAAAFLPSSTCMALIMLSFSFWLANKDFQAIFVAVLCVLVPAWPFVAVVFLPLAVEIFYRNAKQGGPRSVAMVLLKGLLSGVLVLPTVVAIDSAYYGRNTSSSLNILLYNTLGGQGDELYGVEPPSYYLKNMLLNLNVVWLLAFAAPILFLRMLVHGDPLCRTMSLWSDSETSSSAGEANQGSSDGNGDGTSKESSTSAATSATASTVTQARGTHKDWIRQRRKKQNAANDPPTAAAAAAGAAVTAAAAASRFAGTGAPACTNAPSAAAGSPSGVNEPRWRIGCVFASAMLWLGLLFLRPHKEERFLYPAYPVLALMAAFALSECGDWLQAVLRDTVARAIHAADVAACVKTSRAMTRVVVVGVLFGSALVSCSRIAGAVANYQGYITLWQYAHERVWPEIEQEHRRQQPGGAFEPAQVCIGSEWHFFPSSFFLSNSNVGTEEHVRLAFVASEFKGQLPQPFNATGGTAGEPAQPFNDLNREEPSRYVDVVNDCDFIVTRYREGLEIQGQSQTMRAVLLNKGAWEHVVSTPVIDSERSRAPWRSFHVPGLSSSINVWSRYTLFRRVRDTDGSAGADAASAAATTATAAAASSATQ